MRCQIRLHGLNANDVGIGPDIEDLCGERVGNRHDGNIRLLTQVEAQTQGAMCGKVTNERVGQPLFLLFLVTFSIFFFIIARSSIVLPTLLVGRLSVAFLTSFVMRFIVLGADETPFDPKVPS